MPRESSNEVSKLGATFSRIRLMDGHENSNQKADVNFYIDDLDLEQ